MEKCTSKKVELKVPGVDTSSYIGLRKAAFLGEHELGEDLLGVGRFVSSALTLDPKITDADLDDPDYQPPARKKIQELLLWNATRAEEQYGLIYPKQRVYLPMEPKQFRGRLKELCEALPPLQAAEMQRHLGEIKDVQERSDLVEFIRSRAAALRLANKPKRAKRPSRVVRFKLVEPPLSHFEGLEPLSISHILELLQSGFPRLNRSIGNFL